MTSVRIYNVERRDGHGRIDHVTVPAHSKESAESYFDNRAIRSSATYRGFEKVSLRYNGSEISFHTDNHIFESDSVGYEYLCNYMTSSINEFIRQLKSSGDYP